MSFHGSRLQSSASNSQTRSSSSRSKLAIAAFKHHLLKTFPATLHPNLYFYLSDHHRTGRPASSSFRGAASDGVCRSAPGARCPSVPKTLKPRPRDSAVETKDLRAKSLCVVEAHQFLVRLDASGVVEEHGRPLDERWAVHNFQGLDGDLQELRIKVTQKPLERTPCWWPAYVEGNLNFKQEIKTRLDPKRGRSHLKSVLRNATRLHWTVLPSTRLNRGRHLFRQRNFAGNLSVQRVAPLIVHNPIVSRVQISEKVSALTRNRTSTFSSSGCSSHSIRTSGSVCSSFSLVRLAQLPVGLSTV
jgi:hypothetical protein